MLISASFCVMSLIAFVLPLDALQANVYAGNEKFMLVFQGLYQGISTFIVTD